MAAHARSLSYTCPFCSEVVWRLSTPPREVPQDAAAAIAASMDTIVEWHMQTHVQEMEMAAHEG